MQVKTKKNILLFIVIISFGFTIAGQFSPVTTYKHSEYLEEERQYFGLFEWKADYYYLVNYMYYFNGALVTVGEEPVINEYYFILHVIPIIISDEPAPIIRGTGFEITYGYSPSLSTIGVIVSVINTVVMIGLFFNGIMSLKEINKKKTKAPLYAAILCGFAVFFITFGSCFIVNSTDIEGLGRINYIKLHLGFYYVLLAGILYAIVFIFQNKIWAKEGKKETDYNK